MTCSPKMGPIRVWVRAKNFYTGWEVYTPAGAALRDCHTFRLVDITWKGFPVAKSTAAQASSYGADS